MKVLVTLVCLFALSLVANAIPNCDYNVTSVAQLISILNTDQNDWTTVPTLCFSNGTFTLTGITPLMKSQNWVGAQAGVDPTCGRLPNPPCERLQSATARNPAIETVLVTNHYIESASVVGIIFTMDGFTIADGSQSLILASPVHSVQLTLSNSYFSSSQQIVNIYATFDRCYFIASSIYSSYYVMDSSTVSTTATNSFFLHAGLATSGVITVIGNTFAFTMYPLQIGAYSHIENNAFYYSLYSAIQDNNGGSFFKGNTFWVFDKAVEADSKMSTINYDSNCFIDSHTYILQFGGGINTTDAVFTNNYFGPFGPRVNNGQTTGSYFGSYIEVSPSTPFNFTYTTTPPTLQSPTVCFDAPLQLSVKPYNIKLGETVNVTISLNLDPVLIGSGVTPDLWNGITLTLFLYATGDSAPNYQTVKFPGGSTYYTWNPSTEPVVSFPWTPTASMLENSPNDDSPPNFFLALKGSPSGSTDLGSSYTPLSVVPMIITPKVPLECYNMSLTIAKNVTAGALRYTFQQLGCPSDDWRIYSVNASSLNLFTYYLSANSLQINVGRNTSGFRIAHYQVGFRNSYVYNVLPHLVTTKITIVNHNPVINTADFTWTYPRTSQTFPAWNLLSGCSDEDGDVITVVQIQKTKARTESSVIQLDPLTLYFVPEKTVVSVQPTGEVTFSAPANTNPVTAGAALSLFWNKQISFQFQITDGDGVNANAWGTANINSALPPPP
eukprot:TRINITY_DN532_c0_g1_i3.p1 TRINITY_DN532_c0_g1~~TRINITY_DN532_c0_g1_i3.p1  ORF type:complete len:724 (-),score=135.93 TRINITY_DN532_c0_g1_i3:192-2363(-)